MNIFLRIFKKISHISSFISFNFLLLCVLNFQFFFILFWDCCKPSHFCCFLFIPYQCFPCLDCQRQLFKVFFFLFRSVWVFLKLLFLFHCYFFIYISVFFSFLIPNQQVDTGQEVSLLFVFLFVYFCAWGVCVYVCLCFSQFQTDHTIFVLFWSLHRLPKPNRQTTGTCNLKSKLKHQRRRKRKKEVTRANCKNCSERKTSENQQINNAFWSSVISLLLP